MIAVFLLIATIKNMAQSDTLDILIFSLSLSLILFVFSYKYKSKLLSNLVLLMVPLHFISLSFYYSHWQIFETIRSVYLPSVFLVFILGGLFFNKILIRDAIYRKEMLDISFIESRITESQRSSIINIWYWQTAGLILFLSGSIGASILYASEYKNYISLLMICFVLTCLFYFLKKLQIMLNVDMDDLFAQPLKKKSKMNKILN